MKKEERLTEDRVYSRLEFIGDGMATLYNRLVGYENTGLSPIEIKELQAENAELKARLNPQTLYGIENGKVEKLLNVEVEYHFDRKASTNGRLG